MTPVNGQRKISALFWKEKPSHWERMHLSAFVFQNPINYDIFFEWVDVYRMCDNEKDTKHMKALLDYFKQGCYIRSLYAWNTTKENKKALS